MNQPRIPAATAIQPPDTRREREALAPTWQEPAGLLGWFQATTHQAIGKRYIVTAFLFLLIGGVEALLMRVQLAKPDNTFLGPARYNQIFTVHGTTMMFLFAVPMMEGMAVYLVPDARNPQCGVSAPQCIRLLDVPVRRRVSL